MPLLFFIGFSILWWISQKKKKKKKKSGALMNGTNVENVERDASNQVFTTKFANKKKTMTIRTLSGYHWMIQFGCTLFSSLPFFVHFAFNFSPTIYVLFFDRFGLISDRYKSDAVGKITARYSRWPTLLLWYLKYSTCIRKVYELKISPSIQPANLYDIILRFCFPK